MTKTNGSIALFGTSADPPTFGHQALLQGLVQLFPKVLTWASNNPMKSHKASLENRKELLYALVNDLNSPSLKLMQELSSPWAIQTLEIASEKWPDNDFTFVIGSDLIDQIPSWNEAKKVLERARIGIAPRQGWPIKKKQLDTLKDIGGKVDLLPLTIPPSSSSEIHHNQKSCHIPKSILHMVQKLDVYGLKDIRQ